MDPIPSMVVQGTSANKAHVLPYIHSLMLGHSNNYTVALAVHPACQQQHNINSTHKARHKAMKPKHGVGHGVHYHNWLAWHAMARPLPSGKGTCQCWSENALSAKAGEVPIYATPLLLAKP